MGFCPKVKRKFHPVSQPAKSNNPNVECIVRGVFREGLNVDGDRLILTDTTKYGVRRTT